MIDKGELKRNNRTGQFYVEVIFGTNDLNLWHGLVEHCAKALSNSELRDVYEGCSKQLHSMKADDIPLIFKEMMDELKQTIINRKAFVPNQGKYYETIIQSLDNKTEKT